MCFPHFQLIKHTQIVSAELHTKPADRCHGNIGTYSITKPIFLLSEIKDKQQQKEEEEDATCRAREHADRKA